MGEVTLGALLRKLRAQAGLTQEELAASAGLSTRAVSDLERGVAQTARMETARLLADALSLEGPDRTEFEATARGRPQVTASPALGTGDTGGTVAATAAPRALPRDTASFTGRETELHQLMLPVMRADSGGVVSIYAIGGMAGVGKTALAVHAAHRLAHRFPDGQVFLRLHGHTPGQQPVQPEDALGSLLQIAGVPAGQIPPDLEARTALWRDHLAGKRMLLVLDDAASPEQVAPLLPGTGGNLVLVTSRRHLIALDDVQSISLDTLPPGQAAELFTRLAARPDLRPTAPAIGEITRLCEYLPLAIGILARQLYHHPRWTIRTLADDLADATTRLELMHTENLSVAVAFDLSYAELPDAQRRFFRQLGLHPGADFDVYAAAALGGMGLSAARRHLEDLYERYLIGEPARGRYRQHDLIREHARALAADDHPDERHAALDRLLDYYAHAAAASDRLLALHPGTRPDPVASAPPAAVPALGDQVRALAWARTERANLLDCLDHASRTGDRARVVAITAGLSGLLRIDGPWADAITWYTSAIDAASKLDDKLAQANALNDLGSIRQLAGDYREATEVLGEALGIYQGIGEQLGQADTLSDLGLVRWLASDYPGAADALERALNIFRHLDDRQGQANALLDLGATQIVIGNATAAVDAIEQALAIYRLLGERESEAQALLDLGNARLETGDYRGAAQVIDEGLGIARDLDDRRGEAWVHIYLGRLRRLTGDYAGGTQAVDKALGIFKELGDKRGCGNALVCRGTIQRLTDDLDGAAKNAETAMAIFTDLGEPRGRARALCELGIVRLLAGDLTGAAEALEDALSIYRDIGDRSGEAEALNGIATLHLRRGETDRATEYHQQALALAHEIDSPWHKAHALAGLGRADLAVGRIADATERQRQAQGIFQRIGAAAAASVAADPPATEPMGQAFF